MAIPAVDKSDLSTYFMSYGDLDTMKGQVNYADTWMYDNEVYGVPSTATTQGIVYNKKAFEDAGITDLPKTPSPLNDAGEVSEAVDYVEKEDPEHNGEYSNSWYSYSWMTARKLGAQIHDIAQGESLCSITRDGSMRRTISEWRPLGIKSIIIRSLALQLTGTFPCIVRSL